MQNFVADHLNAIKLAARAGYAARGAVFLIVGYFAFRAAYASGQAMDTRDAIDKIAGSAFGETLLVLLVLALTFFAIWRIIQVVFDVDRHGHDARGVFVRLGLTVSAFAYGALAVYAASLLIGMGKSGGGNGFMTKAYEAGYGAWITYAFAAGVAAAGAAHVVKGAKAGFLKYMTLPSETQGWLKRVCQFGLIARGVAFFILAGLLISGAAAYSGGETPGLKTALSSLSQWPYGWILLATMGLGLIAFGIYALTEARYRRINVEAVT